VIIIFFIRALLLVQVSNNYWKQKEIKKDWVFVINQIF
jgi:hypothetical protein